MPAIPIHPPRQHANAPIDLGPGLPPVFNTPGGLALVEIQGTINSHSDLGALDAIGELSFPYYDATKSPSDTSWHKRVHLSIGQYQRLTGEVKKLPKPLAIIRRRGGGGDANELLDQTIQTSGDTMSEELEIADVVYYKLLFAHRPEPVGTGGRAS